MCNWTCKLLKIAAATNSNEVLTEEEKGKTRLAKVWTYTRMTCKRHAPKMNGGFRHHPHNTLCLQISGAWPRAQVESSLKVRARCTKSKTQKHWTLSALVKMYACRPAGFLCMLCWWNHSDGVILVSLSKGKLNEDFTYVECTMLETEIVSTELLSRANQEPALKTQIHEKCAPSSKSAQKRIIGYLSCWWNCVVKLGLTHCKPRPPSLVPQITNVSYRDQL